MTQSREVLAMMDAHTTTFGRKRGCTVTPCGAFLFGAAFLISLVATGLLVYHLAPCLEEELVKPCGDFSNSVFGVVICLIRTHITKKNWTSDYQDLWCQIHTS